jgi:hypothetical protein
MAPWNPERIIKYETSVTITRIPSSGSTSEKTAELSAIQDAISMKYPTAVRTYTSITGTNLLICLLMNIPDNRTQTNAMDDITYLDHCILPVVERLMRIQRTAIPVHEIVNSLKNVVRFLKNGNATVIHSSTTAIIGYNDQVIVELPCKSTIMGIMAAIRKHMERMKPVRRLATLRLLAVEGWLLKTG